MSDSRLTPLQERVLAELAGRPAGWTLTGGGALAGFHTRHRTTRDLDLFWHGRSELGALGPEVMARLEASGLTVTTSATALAHVRYLVRSGDQQLEVDLVADPVAPIEPPVERSLGSRPFLVDTAHEILVNKLTTLIQRTELRDLVDVGALLDQGGDLARALADAPRKDSGFSPLTLSWLLNEFPVVALAQTSGLTGRDVESLIELRDRLVKRIVTLTASGR